MAINTTQFRQNFPEFASLTTYPDATVNMWLQWAYTFLSAPRWTLALDLGAQLYSAHYLTLQAKAIAEAANGNPPGRAVGPISSKTVGELTMQYDSAVGSTDRDGQWAATVYGTQFINLARQFGAGPVQTPPGIAPAGQFPGVFLPMGGAWPGPWFENFSD